MHKDSSDSQVSGEWGEPTIVYKTGKVHRAPARLGKMGAALGWKHTQSLTWGCEAPPQTQKNQLQGRDFCQATEAHAKD